MPSSTSISLRSPAPNSPIGFGRPEYQKITGSGIRDGAEIVQITQFGEVACLFRELPIDTSIKAPTLGFVPVPAPTLMKRPE